ncbi:MAG: META domain-containing protein [Hymenobacteraceae bacterium]|nr:META domain-containing protein [Hymenobacteraceae bacterium]MDX5398100.1 META domain-containing protein [Hymenobacteraceae bacterium]MDX5442524.1 META domain-containing protein [Hymenobacteraceae bacterium]MDX5514172.1 META domain-containing protein [Hymenobacteraceae bacterium]
MKKYLHLPLALLLFTACGPETRETEELETTEVSEDETVYRNAVRKLALGRWQGTIPCADCPGIDYTLFVYPDSTFREERVYKGKNEEPFVQTGNWEIIGDSVISLQGDKQQNSRIQVTANRGLIKLDTHGEKVTGALAESYRLRKLQIEKMLEDSEEVWQDKQQEGIDFIAVGSSPDWLLEIDNEKLLQFKTHASAKLDVSTPAVKPERSATGDTLYYNVQTEIGALEIVLQKKPCTNNLYGSDFSYAVEVKVSGTPFEGCGKFLNDNRINGKWTLQMLNNQVVEPDSVTKNAPFIDFQANSSRVTGNAGCNRFSGNVFAQGSQLRFSPLTTTRMACPKLETEQKFMKVLNSQNLTFAIDPDRLTLFENGKPVAVFKRSAPETDKKK